MFPRGRRPWPPKGKSHDSSTFQRQCFVICVARQFWPHSKVSSHVYDTFKDDMQYGTKMYVCASSLIIIHTLAIMTILFVLFICHSYVKDDCVT